MDKFIINGGQTPSGSVEISNSKNSSLPIMAAVLLSQDKLSLKSLPDLKDIRTMKLLLSKMGVKVNGDEFDASDITSIEAPYELVKTMRASVLVLGPLLSRFGEAKVSMPGGCAIGTRPVDQHLKGLELMGATIKLENGFIHAKCSQLSGANILLDFPSVGATENLIMAAVYAQGITVIKNAAMEPEITDLCHFLLKLFPKLEINGLGTSEISIKGINRDSTCQQIEYSPISDRIEACTFIILAAMSNSSMEVLNCVPKHFQAVINLLESIGVNLKTEKDKVIISPSLGKLREFDVETAPYPLFPTDVQAQLMSLATVIDGKSSITENIFENRFMHVPEMNRMGAKIELKGKTAIIQGGYELYGAPVMCTDLRASAALVLNATVAKGESEVLRVYHIDRGYDGIDRKLQKLGVDIKRVGEKALKA